MNPGRGFAKEREICLIAQDVERVLPELVRKDSHGDKAFAYDKMVPMLIEAVKDQQTVIKEKAARIEKLEKALEMMELRVVALQGPARTIVLK